MPQVMNNYLAISYQLPDLAQYRYCYLTMFLDAHDMLWWIVYTILIPEMHDYDYGVIIVLVHTKCIKHMRNFLLC